MSQLKQKEPKLQRESYWHPKNRVTKSILLSKLFSEVTFKSKKALLLPGLTRECLNTGFQYGIFKYGYTDFTFYEEDEEVIHSMFEIFQHQPELADSLFLGNIFDHVIDKGTDFVFLDTFSQFGRRFVEWAKLNRDNFTDDAELWFNLYPERAAERRGEPVYTKKYIESISLDTDVEKHNRILEIKMEQKTTLIRAAQVQMLEDIFYREFEIVPYYGSCCMYILKAVSTASESRQAAENQDMRMLTY
jgi:hypothetical protein